MSELVENKMEGLQVADEQQGPPALPDRPPPGEEGKDDGEPPAPVFDWMPEGCTPLADGEYDVIICGTGMKECMLAGLLCKMGRKTLHVDRNGYYGGESASLNLSNLYKKFKPNEEPPAFLGQDRDYNVDLIPKFIMANGDLVRILIHTGVNHYLEFRHVDGSYVLKNGKILKVPATPEEALKSSLMGMFEKRRFRKFLIYVSDFTEETASTGGGVDATRANMRQVFEHFGLDENTMSFIGHAMALQRSDAYLDEPAVPTLKAIQLYCFSLERYGRSPYIYPMWGLGGLPEGFSRMAAINEGTFILNCPVDEVLFDGAGKAWGIRAGAEVAKAPVIIGDPSYFAPEKVRATGRVVRSICFLDRPIPGTQDRQSVQLILPARQTGRQTDIYVCMVSKAHEVCKEGIYVAIASTVVETNDPVSELAPAFDLLPPVIQRFDSIVDSCEPVNDWNADGCFITSTYDETSHFQTAVADVYSLFEKITGSPLDLASIDPASVSEF